MNKEEKKQHAELANAAREALSEAVAKGRPFVVIVGKDTGHETEYFTHAFATGPQLIGAKEAVENAIGVAARQLKDKLMAKLPIEDLLERLLEGLVPDNECNCPRCRAERAA